MSREIYARTAQKHDILVNWARAVNFIPAKGEIIVYDPDDDCAYSRFKIGDGATVAHDLPFAAISPEELATFEQGVAEFLYEIYGDDIPQDGESTPTVREIANSEATTEVSAHNTATNAHADIRAAIPVIQMVTWESDD